MRVFAAVLTLTLALVMGHPTPEIPAVMKIPKPGINLQERGRLPLSVIEESQLNIKPLEISPVEEPKVIEDSKLKIKPFEISPKPVGTSERLFPIEEPKAIEDSQVKIKPFKLSPIPVGTKERLFPLEEPQNEPLFSLEDTSAEVSFKSSDDLTTDISSDEEEAAEEHSLFTSSFDAAGIEVSSAALTVAVKPKTKLTEETSSVKAHVDALVADVPVQTIDSPQIFFEEGTDVPVDQGIQRLSSPAEEDSVIITSITPQVPEMEVPSQIFEPAMAVPAQVPVMTVPLTVAEPVVATAPQVPVMAVPLSASEPVMAAPMMVAVVPDPLNAPEPPMPRIEVPFVGGQYHGQDEAGQYSFSHWGGPSTRVEVKDLTGVVAGSFAYVNPEGEIHVRKYVAEPSKGFRVAASDLPVDRKTVVEDTPEVAKVKEAHADLMAGVRAAQSRAKTMSS